MDLADLIVTPSIIASIVVTAVLIQVFTDRLKAGYAYFILVAAFRYYYLSSSFAESMPKAMSPQPAAPADLI